MRSFIRPARVQLNVAVARMGHAHASKSCPTCLKPSADAWQADADCLDVDEGGSVYGLLQRIRTLTHVALLTQAVYKEPVDCGNHVGEYDSGSGLEVRP